MIRGFYLSGVILCIHNGWSKSSFTSSGGLSYLTFLCATYRSLFITSGLSLFRLCGILFIKSDEYIPPSVSLEKSYLLESYKTHNIQNAYIFSSKFQERIISGLNVTHLIHLVSSNLRLVLKSVFDISYHPSGLGLIFLGRIKGHIRNRSVAKMNALCVTDFTSRILDIGYKTSISSLGLLGLKVGTII